MATQIVLLRGINVGGRNKLPMADLRAALTDAGFADVQTYVQSGNVVLSGSSAPAATARRVHDLVAETFGLDVAVVARTRAELAAVVKRNPLRAVATEPKRYQVSFLGEKLDRDTVAKIDAVTVAPEQFTVVGREIYAWHPDGVARSPLWAMLAGPKLGVPATARNWTTVTKLLELAGD